MTEAVIGWAGPVESGSVPRWRLAAGLVAGAAFGLLVAVALLAVVATQFLGFRLLTVSSDSMAPALATGDIIVVKPVAIASVHPGDIVLFESGSDDVLTVHRVIARNELVTNITSRSTGERTTLTDYSLITKGDANPAPDGGEVVADQLHGEVWFSVTNPVAKFGLPLQALLFIFAAATAIAWLLWEFWTRVRPSRTAAQP